MSKSLRFSILLFFNAAVFIAAALLLPVMFEDNDDVTMAWIASGIYSGMPDCHVVFINAIWGQLLAWLYSWLPAVEWYSVLFAVLQVFSMTIIVGFANHRIKNKIVSVATSVLFYLFWLLIIVRFQFTTTAAITAFAATTLLYDRKFVKGGVLFVIAGLIRFSAAGLVGLLMAPALVHSYQFDIKKSYIPIIVVLAICFLSHKSNELFYQSPEWQYYSEFNRCRGKINDNPNLWRVVGNIPDGISESEFLSIWAFAIDPNVTTLDDLRIVLNQINATPLYKKVKNFYSGVLRKYWNVLLYVLLLLLSVAAISKKKQCWFTCVGIFLIWLFVLLLISLNCSVKYRVFLSSLFPVLFYAVFVLSTIEEYSSRDICAVLLPVIILSLYFGNNIQSKSDGIEEKSAKFIDQKKLVEQSSDSIIIPYGADYMVDMYPPFKLNMSIPSEKFINPYCMMASPLNKEYDSFDDLVDGKLVILSQTNASYKNYINILLDYYEIKADTLVVNTSGDYSIVKLVSQ